MVGDVAFSKFDEFFFFGSVLYELSRVLWYLEPLTVSSFACTLIIQLEYKLSI